VVEMKGEEAVVVEGTAVVVVGEAEIDN